MDKEISKDFNPEPQKYFTVRQFSERHSISIGSLRSMIFFSKQTGFDKCLRRLGKKIFISEPDYFQYMEEHKYAE